MTRLPGVPDSDDVNEGMAAFNTGPFGRRAKRARTRKIICMLVLASDLRAVKCFIGFSADDLLVRLASHAKTQLSTRQ